MKEYRFRINGKDYEVRINSVDNGIADLAVNGKPYKVEIEGEHTDAKPAAADNTAVVAQSQSTAPDNTVAIQPQASQVPAATNGQGEVVKSPLPGVIVNISVNVGDKVKEGQEVAVLEAMKMENSIEASVSGTVTAINVSKGDSVPEGAVIITIG